MGMIRCPGIGLTEFDFDLTQSVPVPGITLSAEPYRVRVLGIDFETTAGAFGIRGEAAFSKPEISYQNNEYIPLPEIKWVAGIDWSSGVWRITGEYNGKYITDFFPSSVDPLIGSEADYSELLQLLSIPGFDLEDYVRKQVGAFNRQFNYQAERIYHSAGLRIEAELVYGKLLPSVFGCTISFRGDLLVIPEIRIKPADGLSITAGAEVYSGREGSLYDLVDDFMNSVYVSLRVDFLDYDKFYFQIQMVHNLCLHSYIGALSAIMIPRIKIDPEIRNYVPPTIKSRIETEKIETEFGVQDLVVILFSDKNILNQR